jgi:hypothetical protein
MSEQNDACKGCFLSLEVAKREAMNAWGRSCK